MGRILLGLLRAFSRLLAFAEQAQRHLITARREFNDASRAASNRLLPSNGIEWAG
jgi:hypothetical protein